MQQKKDVKIYGSPNYFERSIISKTAERLQLIESLTLSLNKPDEKIEQMWAEESKKRYKALEEGNVKTITLKEILD